MFKVDIANNVSLKHESSQGQISTEKSHSVLFAK